MGYLFAERQLCGTGSNSCQVLLCRKALVSIGVFVGLIVVDEAFAFS